VVVLTLAVTIFMSL